MTSAPFSPEASDRAVVPGQIAESVMPIRATPEATSPSSSSRTPRLAEADRGERASPQRFRDDQRGSPVSMWRFAGELAGAIAIIAVSAATVHNAWFVSAYVYALYWLHLPKESRTAGRLLALPVGATAALYLAGFLGAFLHVTDRITDREFVQLAFSSCVLAVIVVCYAWSLERRGFAMRRATNRP